MKQPRYVCIHGHFYQPPRENPWLEAVELQDSAHPYHDWNERISAECYAPNGAARILDENDLIARILNNYSQISFNFGPTLLSWLETKAPVTYQAILEADRKSQQRFSGHGSAIAQTYNHMILPLANPRDQRTQILWGIRDFERRFGRRPEGMWLAETAVDLRCLELLAEHGISFTILSPYQARRVRRFGARAWREASGGRIDPTMAYQQKLPGGKSIALFFYDGPVSRAVAFEHLLNRGEDFVDRIMSGFNDARDWPQLMHIATDGESYGHHHRHGDMALAYATECIGNHPLTRMTVYGEYLERHPPTHEVEILERTSWSCAHGIDRWWTDCGCNSGGHPGWNQKWREPLRNALDWLREELAPRFEGRGAELFGDPWQARDEYIEVVLDRSPENVEAFLARHATGLQSEEDQITRLKLLEMQRHAMLMYTSCGWFFDELSGIETIQVMQYAARALQLARDLFGDDLEAPFLEHLERARSNIAAHRDGRSIYQKWIRPAIVDLERLSSHYAVNSLFETLPEKGSIYSYEAEQDRHEGLESGRMKLSVGRAMVRSTITWESAIVSYAALHLGDHNVSGGVRMFQGDEAYGQMRAAVTSAFLRADVPELIHRFKEYFGESTFSLRSLFRDEQVRALELLLASSREDAARAYIGLYELTAPVLRLLSDLNLHAPRDFRIAAERALNHQLAQELEREELDFGRITRLLREVRDLRVELDRASLGLTLQQRVEETAARFAAEPREALTFEALRKMVDLIHELPFDVDLWRVQNTYFQLLGETLPAYRTREAAGDATAGDWVRSFAALGRKLHVRVE